MVNEKNIYDSILNKLTKKNLYKIDDDTIYFVVNYVLYGYCKLILEEIELNVLWKEIRDFDIDNENNIRFYEEVKCYYLLEHNNVVELFGLL